MNNPVLIVLLFLLVTACASRQPAPVDEINTHSRIIKSKSTVSHNKQKSPKYYRVKKGDSLYSIGFRYQIDYRTLAAINNIGPPYRIYPKQRLTLNAKPANHKTQKTAKQKTATQAITTQPKLSSQNTNSQSPTKQKSPAKITAPVTPKPITQSNSQNSAKKPPSQPKAKPSAQAVSDMSNKGDLNWLWPTAGEIRTTFLASNPARKGISIRGQEGQDVKAAEAGIVVYSGDGLLGYGELIIIKHNNSYLSAYGHNKKRKVSEGQKVNRGQVIALLGSSGTNVNNLHFEIRKNGQPVNPLDYVKP